MPKKQNRRQEILDATMKVLAYEGHASVTMRGIAERVGIRLSTLQYYFPSKKELLKSAIEHCIGGVVEKMNHLASESRQEPTKLLHRVLKLHLEISRDPFTSRFFSALWALAGHDPEVESILNEVYERDIERYSGFIRRANPELSNNECELRAVMILALLEGLVLMVTPGRLRDKKIKSIEKQLDRIIDTTILN